MDISNIGKLIDDELRERVVEDLKLMAEDARDVWHNTSDEAAQRLHETRARVESTLSSARERFSAAEERLIDTTRNVVAKTDAYVQKHPWQAVSAGLLSGVVLGMLFSKRR